MIERIAHRGNSMAARENTLAAFRAAIDAGCDLIELDVRTTADGRSVVLHDESVLRLWGEPRMVADMTWAEVSVLGLADLRIPRLSDALDLVAGTGVGVLVDSTCARDALIAYDVVHEHPAVQTGKLDIQWCGHTDGMLAIRERDADAVIRYAGIDADTLALLRPTYINAEWSYLSAEQVAWAHAQGYKVACWTPETAAEFQVCRDMGVDAITTNHLRLLNAVLADSPRPAPGTRYGVDLAEALRVATTIAERVIGLTRDAPVTGTTAKASAADFVTDVDLAVERLVRDTLAEVFPDHVVVGEEFGGEPQPGVPTWYVDPVDGSTNLGNGIGWTSLSLALAVDEEPLLGVVAQPATGDVAAAVTGAGATLNGLPVRPRHLDTLAGTTVGLELAAQHPWAGMDDVLRGLAAADATARIMGSGTLTLTLPGTGRGAAGHIHAFNPIDHLAAVVIGREAGCRILQDGRNAPTFPAHGLPVTVTCPGVADQLAAIVAASSRES